ncbi:MAG: XRE family transcriptional regulator [Lachnospiraceae bacterium]|nr:XRE family transcriptional regulator [Robinsoniella sp.]MDY3765825.1 XRE family transcriptional regulator [Lachnospiraceae bacterium]
MDYLSHNIAINLKRIRKAKGMSLDVVAEQTGVSKSMLSTIEKGDANPSIGVLGKIISGLRIELQDLTQPPQGDSYLVDIGKVSPTKAVEGQYHVWTCFPISDNRTVEIYRIDIEPGGSYESGSHGERTKEYIAMLEGELSVRLEDGIHVVKKEQLFRFESDQPHVYFNTGTGKLSFMSFFVVY